MDRLAARAQSGGPQARRTARPCVHCRRHAGPENRGHGRPLRHPEVFNQSPPYADVDLLRQRPAAAGGGRGQRRGRRGGRRSAPSAGAGARPTMFEQARLANENPPQLRTFDAQGAAATASSSIRPITISWPRASRAGLHASTWQADATRAPAPAEVARAARYYMVAQVENGHMCPITMTRAAVAALRRRARARQDADAEAHLAALRPDAAAVAGEDRHHARHGHDREAGRHRRARQHHARRARRRRIPDHRPQVVHVGADVATPSWCWRRRRAG